MGKIDKSRPVLVTGATGYIASWVIKYLIDEGFTVHGTVRDTSNHEKSAHLFELGEKKPGKLKLFNADLLKEGSFAEAMEGCSLVIHTASPFFVQGIKDPQKQLIDPAVKGTKNVLMTANNTESVSRVVLTSSVVAIFGDAVDKFNTKNGVFTEREWNTTSSLTHQPYSYSKTLAEKEAWKLAGEQNRWDLVVINPGFVMGPSQSKRTDSTSIDFMRSMVNGKFAMGVPDFYFAMVDVREVARAHVNAGLLEKASGRHALVTETVNALDVADMLRDNFRNRFKIPKRKLPNLMIYLFGPFQGFGWKYLRKNLGIPFYIDNTYSKTDLGMEYRPIRETLTGHVEQLERDGLI